MAVQIPNSSFFPEIDFASKCLKSNPIDQSTSINQLLAPLGNANSSNIYKQLEQTRIYVGAEEIESEGIQHITVTTVASTEKLVEGKKYN